MRKKRKYFFVILFFLFFFRIFLSHAEIVDKIRATVNDEVITQSDVDKLLLPVYAQYRSLYTGQELEEKIGEIRDNVLRRLIEDKLLLAQAKRKGIEVTAKELNDKIAEVKKRFSTEAEFETALVDGNIYLSELEKQLKEQLMIEKLVNSELQNKISVSPTELLGFYERYKSEFCEPSKIMLRAILIKIKDDRTEDEAMKIAQKILYRLREGSDFGLLAKQYSEGPYVDSGGDMGWVEKGELMDEIDGLVFQMKKGETSGILKTKLGFHIFKVEEKKEPQAKEFDKVKAEIEQILYNEKRKGALQELIEELRKNAHIAFR